ncbi:MAG: peptidoglycan-binding domain-containing protein [Acutalibacteraceae bacterium]|jgi:peptidoglycan hydrolase-like protein with peptidoglycan-binding domain
MIRDLPNNDLRYDEAMYIRELQGYLRSLSYRWPELPLLGIDGVYGSQTADAVAAFQRWFRLEETGITDRITWEMIAAAANALTQSDPPPLRETP